ncbi:MAG: phospholipid-binding lipoprotein MlaA [Candidatus Binatota bacterium]|jgi:phospholipid-binding lipoprotein MlaA|nr:phospholipid-binding lipoprotein MlaA [Candidatus Binatota bacterium]
MKRAALATIFLAALAGGVHAGTAAPYAADPDPPEHPGDYDPLERVNRGTFWVNDHFDVYLLEPVAKAWDWIAPDPLQRSISHFFQNVRFPVVFANDLFQGKPREAGIDVARFVINTTVGVAGFMDPAEKWWGLEPHVEDFGQTLGRWGSPAGAYLVIPILGPSNVRDAFGLAGDYPLTIVPFFVDQYILWGARVAEGVNERSLYLQQVRDAKEAALDYYSFVRNAYHQRRVALINDSRVEAKPQNEQDLYFFDNPQD